MHVVMTLTATYDREMNNPLNSETNVFELDHYNRAIAMFSHKLSMSIAETDKDALWVTCSIFKAVCFSHYDAVRPEDARPLNHNISSPLDWITLQDGFHAVWGLIGPLEPHSPFSDVVNKLLQASRQPISPIKEVTGIHPLMIQLFELTDSSHDSNNPILSCRSPYFIIDANRMQQTYHFPILPFQWRVMPGSPKIIVHEGSASIVVTGILVCNGEQSRCVALSTSCNR